MRTNSLHCPAFWHFSWSNFTFYKIPFFLIALLLTCIVCFGILIVTTHQNYVDVSQDPEPKAVTDRKIHEGILVPTDMNDPNIHYGVLIDAGSSGSRVFVYCWPTHRGNPKELLHIEQVIDKSLKPVVKKVSPGLSSFANSPQQSSHYLKPLLDFAAKHVPKNKHSETPLYIMATAGMRMIPESAQKAIIENLQVDIKLQYKFLFSDSHVEVISGKQEGVYAWIATNYVLGRFHHDEDDAPMNFDVNHPHIRKTTVGIIDMGGGSVQIAYEIPKSADITKNMIAEFNLGCQNNDDDHTYRVYVSTFLGFGANAARSRYENQLLDEVYSSNSTLNTGLNENDPILDPCLPKEMKEKLVGKNKETYHVRGIGDFRLCQKRIQPLLNLTVPCKDPPCSMNGIFQPEIDYTFMDFYGFSEYWYCMDDVLRMGGRYDYIKFLKGAKDYCGTRWPVLEAWYRKKLFPKATRHRFKNQCFKSAWVVEVLHNGFKFPRRFKKFQSAFKIKNTEVQWTLGAILYRTRYFPLREVQQKLNKSKQPWKRNNPLLLNQYIILLCFVLVVAAIVLYMRRLSRISQRTMSRSTSSTFLLLPEDIDTPSSS